MSLRRTWASRWQHLDVLTTDQGFQIGRTGQADFRLDHPELGSGTRDLLSGLSQPHTLHHCLQIISQLNALNLANIQALEADCGTWA